MNIENILKIVNQPILYSARIKNDTVEITVKEKDKDFLSELLELDKIKHQLEIQNEKITNQKAYKDLKREADITREKLQYIIITAEQLKILKDNYIKFAYFEKDDYAAAASFFRLSTAGGDITVSAMRDYAVSLGRLGDIEAADDVLQQMYAAGASGDVTDYVQAEIDYALEKYSAAENSFQSVLNKTDDIDLQKRTVRSLAELYRDCSALARIDESPISYPATKEAELLSNGIVQYGLRFDSTIWEMLALAYFEAYHTDPSVDENYLVKAADCFNRVIELGVSKDYLYSNLYTIYYELEDYAAAEESLLRFEDAFPDNYMPHALRAMMLITIENGKNQSARNYTKAKSEYEVAKQMIQSSDDTTYFQQLESLIVRLQKEGWL